MAGWSGCADLVREKYGVKFIEGIQNAFEDSAWKMFEASMDVYVDSDSSGSTGEKTRLNRDDYRIEIPMEKLRFQCVETPVADCAIACVEEAQEGTTKQSESAKTQYLYKVTTVMSLPLDSSFQYNILDKKATVSHGYVKNLLGLFQNHYQGAKVFPVFKAVGLRYDHVVFETYHTW